MAARRGDSGRVGVLQLLSDVTSMPSCNRCFPARIQISHQRWCRWATLICPERSTGYSNVWKARRAHFCGPQCFFCGLSFLVWFCGFGGHGHHYVVLLVCRLLWMKKKRYISKKRCSYAINIYTIHNWERFLERLNEIRRPSPPTHRV